MRRLLSGLLAIGPPTNSLWVELGARLDFQPFELAAVFVDGSWSKVPWSFGERTSTETKLTAGLVLFIPDF